MRWNQSVPRLLKILNVFLFSTFSKQEDRIRWHKVVQRERKTDHFYEERKNNSRALATQLHLFKGSEHCHLPLPAISWFQPYVFKFGNCSLLVLFVTSCGEYLEKLSLAENHTLPFFQHQCMWGFETDLEIYSVSRGCCNWEKAWFSKMLVIMEFYWSRQSHWTETK